MIKLYGIVEVILQTTGSLYARAACKLILRVKTCTAAAALTQAIYASPELACYSLRRPLISLSSLQKGVNNNKLSMEEVLQEIMASNRSIVSRQGASLSLSLSFLRQFPSYVRTPKSPSQEDCPFVQIKAALTTLGDLNWTALLTGRERKIRRKLQLINRIEGNKKITK